MTLRFKQNGKQYKVVINYRETNDNYPIFANIHDKDGLLFGSNFKEGTSTETIKEYFKSMDIVGHVKKINEDLMAEFKDFLNL